MTRNFYFKGMAKWAKVRKPDSYDKYVVDLYMDDPSFDLFNESGVELKIREDDDGTFVKLSRPIAKEIKGQLVEYEAPKVLDAEGEVMDESILIGNGSQVICKVAVYDTRAGKGHRLEEVKVLDLVEYSEAPEEVTPEDVVPW